MPAEVIADGDTRIHFAVNNNFKKLTSVSLVSFVGDDGDDLAFLRVELNLLLSFTFLQGLTILLD